MIWRHYDDGVYDSVSAIFFHNVSDTKRTYKPINNLCYMHESIPFFLVKQCVWDNFSVLFQLLDPTKLSRWRRNNNGRRDVVWNFNVKTIVHKMHRMYYNTLNPLQYIEQCPLLYCQYKSCSYIFFLFYHWLMRRCKT